MARTSLYSIALYLLLALMEPVKVYAIEMKVTSRRQANQSKIRYPLDFYDSAVRSPKSVKFSDNGDRVFVNALEGMQTLIYDRFGFAKLGVVSHEFKLTDQSLFEEQLNFGYQRPQPAQLSARFNIFGGKPVEMELSHEGKYLWLPYYRRDFDLKAMWPSAISIVNTNNQKIERVLSAGPIPKNIRLSHRGHIMAVTHWGDNTIGLFDIRAKEAKEFKAASLLVDGAKLNESQMQGGDRDENCGHCVRGLAFSPDDRFLFVGRMAEEGISIFDVSDPYRSLYLGTMYGLGYRPRDLETTQDSLIVSFNGSGEISQIPLNWLVTEVLQGITYIPKSKIKSVHVGKGLRSIELTKDGHYVFVAVNGSSEVVAVNLVSMQIEHRVKVDSFPVGLGLSPDEKQLWVTAQGHHGVGGNSVMVIQIRRRELEVIK